ncbi:MAG TPA: helix-turn-helix transcriptional regulator [Tepidisphaeraceae bacterium]|jgi:DNA-binding XRE family transcriptional regulator|nr:helix-turn-helix transcriptional regulator [Tepidisphaeraceae bacterium]
MNTITIDRKKYVLVPEAEYRQMVKGVPPLPEPLAGGNLPALAAIDASIARNIVRSREAVGFSQKDLALAAGIRVEILNRAERGVTIPSVRTLTKIENALVKAGLKRKPLHQVGRGKTEKPGRA